MAFSEEIELCTKCVANESKVDVSEKPYVKFHVEKNWKPEKVKVLFIAESPPWSKERYFYKPDMTGKRTNLQKEVFRYLNLSSLDEFKAKGYFIIDVIKCRLNKTVSDNVPVKILSNCTSKFLDREIISLNPETIFVLGNSAKYALQQLPKFKELKNYLVTEDYDRKVARYRIILSVYPGGKTRKHVDLIRRAFSKIT